MISEEGEQIVCQHPCRLSRQASRISGRGGRNSLAYLTCVLHAFETRKLTQNKIKTENVSVFINAEKNAHA